MTEQRQLVPAGQARPPFFVGVDLGGTNVKVGVVDDLGRPVSWLSILTETKRGAADTTRRMGEAVKQTIRESGVDPAKVVRVGLGSPGTMDIPAGKLVNPVNLKGRGWKGYHIRDRLKARCGKPVAFANDAAAAAYGEFWVGSGRKFRSLVLLTLGTGIGCGIIIHGLSIDGEHSHGAECGHIIIDCTGDARVCGCGQPGHLEAYASATGVIKRTEEALDAGRPSTLRRRIQKEEKKSEERRKGIPELVAIEAGAGDELATEIVMETARYLGIGIVTLMHTVDPNGVLLGGAMTFGGKESPLGRQFLARIKKEVRDRAFAVLAENVKIDFASLGGDAGFIGSAGIARLEYQRLK